MISCSGVSGRYRGGILRTIHRLSHKAAKNARPNARPSTTRVRRTLQNTSESPTSRNHSTSTKNPESAVNTRTRPARTATRTTMSRRRADIGVGAGRRTTMFSGSLGLGRGQRITAFGEAVPLRGVALQVGESVVEARHGNELHASIARGARDGHVALRHQEHARAGVGRGRELLSHARDRDHGPVERDLAGPGYGPSTREVDRR